MTNPVILLGTQSNGETLPVQVDATGRLVAEGLQGVEGPEGPQGPIGPEGPPGPGGIELPPDPYEGALLGWLNGELAWVGSTPIPIPDGVFGPITSWDRETGVVEVSGDIPANVTNGVYIYQCDSQGNYSTPGWNVSEDWSQWCTGQDWEEHLRTYMFDGGTTKGFLSRDGGLWQPPDGIPFYESLKIWVRSTTNSAPITVVINGQSEQVTIGSGGNASRTWNGNGVLNSIKPNYIGGSTWSGISKVVIDNVTLVDQRQSLNARVNQRFSSNGLLVVPNTTNAEFYIGQYLRTPPQRVAPWVLYGNDPTSLIDHLRQTRD